MAITRLEKVRLQLFQHPHASHVKLNARLPSFSVCNIENWEEPVMF